MGLFDDWEAEATAKAAAARAQVLKERRKGDACRNCQHFLTHQYSEKYNYCQLRRDPRTSYGFAKTKRLDWCAKHTPDTSSK